MAGGGTAPAMKMSDVFILLGVTFLLGGLFIHGLVSPVGVDAESDPYTSGASLLKGDSMQFTVEAANQSSFTLEVVDQSGSVVLTDSSTLASGESASVDFEAKEKGFYSFSVEFSEGSGDVLVDVDRKLLIDFIIYPLGAVCVVFGIAKRKDEQGKETLDAVLEPDD
tara:strand:+ start:9274 stop:9774 length:501 start_codon:yes stop_codon:yes gene_type:complete